MAGAQRAKDNALHSNFDVDYVIVYRFAETDKPTAEPRFEKLVTALANVGLATEARNGDNCSILLFVKVASEAYLQRETYKSRVRDWLNGVRQEAPEKDTQQSLSADPLTAAERLRLIYLIITQPRSEGGAGITPKSGEWEGVESIFPLHDHTFNTNWIKSWSTRYSLSINDLDQIRDRLGEKIAFYFAFLQSYFTFLILPAAFGAAAYIMLGQFSPVYAVVNCLWCVVFVEYWKFQETDFAIRWEVRGVSAVQIPRREFKHDKEIKDPVTGETIKVFPATTRLMRQLLQIPFALIAALVLGSLIAICFAIEIFICEVYSGPFKSILVYLPTAILTAFVPILTTTLTGFATRLTEFENYETTDTYEAAMTQKVFVLNFITSYLPIFLTAFVYVPFGTFIVPWLDVFGLTVKAFAEKEKQLETPAVYEFQINPHRLRNQMIYFAVTAQIVNLAMEVIVPYVKRKGFAKVKEIKSHGAAKKGGAGAGALMDDIPEEADFLKRVRGEAELDKYDVTTDLREMVVQFGYLSLFSIIWPLTPVAFIVNNWIELRSDSIKICTEMQRPIPMRADTIGPWLDSLGFLTWLGSLSTAALVYLFSGEGLGTDGTPSGATSWALLLSIFLCEHVYLIVRMAVRTVLSKMDSPGLQKVRAERFMLRKRYLEDTLGDEAGAIADPGPGLDKVNRASLEEEARQSTLGNQTAEDRFWARQRHWQETVEIGGAIIRTTAPAAEKKSQ